MSCCSCLSFSSARIRSCWVLLFRHHQRRTRSLRVSGDLGADGPPAPSPVGWECSAGAEHVNCTQPCPSLPDPQDIQKPPGPGARAPDPRLHGIPSPCIGHSLGEGVALFEVPLLKWGERRPRSLRGPRGSGFETLSSQGCSVTGECPLLCPCTGAAGLLTNLDSPRSPLQRKTRFHPSLQAQNQPLKSTAPTCSPLNCVPNPVPPQLKLQGLELLRQKCPPEPVLLPPTWGSLHPPPPLETVGLSRDPLGHECQLPREQSDSHILSLLSPGASWAGGTGDLRGVLTGPQMAGCL